MLKKFFTGFFVISLMLFNLNTSAVFAEELTLSSPSAILMEAETGAILYSKNSDELRSPASITKVMTLLLTMEAIESGRLNLTDTLYASAHASSMGGSDIWLEEGEAMTVDDLLKATVIMSANDAAVVLAEAISGSEDAFVTEMNKKAAELGMENTVFKNCNGLDEDGHHTTAKDIAIMSAALVQHEKIFDYTLTWMDSVRGGETQLVNTNKLIRTYDGVTGLKTGTTSTAGSCITVTAERESLSLVAVVLGAESSDTRFADATALLNYGFGAWETVQPVIEVPHFAEITGGMKDTVNLEVLGYSNVLVKISEEEKISTEVIISEHIQAPIQKGTILGRVDIKIGDNLLKSLNITASESVEKADFFKVLYSILSNYDM